MSFRVERAGRAALAALRAEPARVFASFERSCYVETPAGIACLGRDIGLGPLNATITGFAVPSNGEFLSFDLNSVQAWKPRVPSVARSFPEMKIPVAIEAPAIRFLVWLQDDGEPDDALIGLGPGLTPAGDDFVGGAMIALRAFGNAAAADRIAAWALPLAKLRTNRISRAHLECAAAGEGHEALHDLLGSGDEQHLARLARLGHTSGLDAAAGALQALARRKYSRGTPSRQGLGRVC